MQKFISLICLLFCYSHVCGRTLDLSEYPRLDGRIVGGETTTINEYPYQVSILYGGSHICGGSIISTNAVLTAAHCMVYSFSGYQVRAGTSNRLSGGTIYEIDSVAHHAQYNPWTYDNDVAVIRIVGTFTLSSEVQPVQLAISGYVPPEGVTSIVTGWGSTSEGGIAANQLQFVEVPIISNQNCRESYATITDSMVCAGYTNGGKDACQGDSGGPLVITNDQGGRIQIGIVSWGIGCAQAGYPGVYASVGHLRSWIAGNSGV